MKRQEPKHPCQHLSSCNVNAGSLFSGNSEISLNLHSKAIIGHRMFICNHRLKMFEVVKYLYLTNSFCFRCLCICLVVSRFNRVLKWITNIKTEVFCFYNTMHSGNGEPLNTSVSTILSFFFMLS